MGDLLAPPIPNLNLIKKEMVVKFKTVLDMNLNYFPFSIFFFLQASSLSLISFSKP